MMAQPGRNTQQEHYTTPVFRHIQHCAVLDCTDVAAASSVCYTTARYVTPQVWRRAAWQVAALNISAVSSERSVSFCHILSWRLRQEVPPKRICMPDLCSHIPEDSNRLQPSLFSPREAGASRVTLCVACAIFAILRATSGRVCLCNATFSVLQCRLASGSVLCCVFI